MKCDANRKKCRHCEKWFARSADISDYRWDSKKYCCHPCAQNASQLRRFASEQKKQERREYYREYYKDRKLLGYNKQSQKGKSRKYNLSKVRKSAVKITREWRREKYVTDPDYNRIMHLRTACKSPIVCVSGGADPLHSGHIKMIQEAAKYGKVIFILNSDAWLLRKKGFKAQNWIERCLILKAIRGIAAVSTVDDADGTVCKALEYIKPDYFANGGDRIKGNTPEAALCKKLGIEMLWGLGGNKIASSSDLVTKVIASGA